MTDPTNGQPRAERALRSLGDAIATGAVPPPAGPLRAHAERWRRARGAGAVLAVAGAVAVAAFGGAHLVSVGEPVPPAVTPPPTVPVDPEPSTRPAPLPSRTLSDPIKEVDWLHVTIDLPPSDHCPTGPIQLAPVTRDGDPFPAAEAQGRLFQLFPDDRRLAYGDLTGDGRVEAVIDAYCLPADQLDGAGEGLAQLLVVGRDDDGTLTGLAYAGPRGAAYLSYWIESGALLAHVRPFRVEPPADPLPPPGVTLGYRWDGGRFTEFEPAPPLLALGPDQPAPPVVPGTVAAGLGCPGNTLTFRRDGEAYGGSATVAGATYQIPPRFDQRFRFFLEPAGSPGGLVVTGLQCTDEAGTTTSGLAVFEPLGSLGWRGVSVLRHPDGLEPLAWRATADPGRLLVQWQDRSQPEAYRWNGTAFEPAG